MSYEHLLPEEQAEQALNVIVHALNHPVYSHIDFTNDNTHKDRYNKT